MNVMGISQLDRLKATLMILLPFLLILATMFVLYNLLLTDRRGAIRVVSNIQGAEILINSSPSSLKTDATIRRLRPDSYDVSVRLDGYLPDPPRQLVQVGKKQTVEVSFNLIPDTASHEELEPLQALSDSVPQPKPTLSWVPSLDSLKKIQKSQREADSLRKPTSRRGKVGLDPTVYTAVSVTSSQDGALILVDDVSTGFTTPANFILNKGTHTIEVQKEGFRSEPPAVEIIVQHAGQREELHFRLVEEIADNHRMALVVHTEPVEGRIYVDDRFCAMGEYQIKNLGYGEYVVSFGSVDGFSTPESQRIEISEDNPSLDVVGAYRPIIYISAGLDEKGQFTKQGVNAVVGGVYFHGSGFTVDKIRGPALKYLEANQFYAWELGYADAERNPPGMDAVEFTFQIPAGFDPDKIVQLRLYGYASNHNYPFTFLNKTEIAIYVNGSGVQSNCKPQYNIDEERALGYDEFDITAFLKEGTNHLMIRTTENSRCFYYLNKFVIL
ncbi:hypothetical protein AMJ86_05445 [bacterium SM23_57]|nr:MAG: hypothetical protein AMJ86_05445 [bacterium SM23_57]